MLKRHTVFLAVILLTACLPTRPPIVTPPVPATMGVHVQVQGTAPIAGALVRLKVALPDTWVEATTPESGLVLLIVPASLTDSQLQVSAQGWVSIDQHVVVSQDCTLTITLHAAHPPTPRLSIIGRFFKRLIGGK